MSGGRAATAARPAVSSTPSAIATPDSEPPTPGTQLDDRWPQRGDKSPVDQGWYPRDRCGYGARAMGKAAAPDVPAIQYLRGIAAMMVVFAHAVHQLGPGTVMFSAIGTSGVDIFFVISGFIMTYMTSARSYTRAGFMWRRIVRIVPIYWAATALTAVIAILKPSLLNHTKFSWTEFGASLSFVPTFNPVTGGLEPLLKLGWTLNYEMMFYVLFCLLLFQPVRRRILELGAIFTITVVANNLPHNPLAALQFYGNPIVFEFLFGCIIGYWFVNERVDLAAAVSAICLAISFSLLVAGSTIAGEGAFVRSIPAAFLVFSAVALQRTTSWRSTALHLIGDASYSTYCTHIFMVMAAAAAWRRFGNLASPIQGTVFVSVCIGASAAIGIATYSWIEKPLIGWLRSLRIMTKAEGAAAQ